MLPPGWTSSTRRYFRSGPACAVLTVALFAAVLLLEACADETPMAPEGTVLPSAASMGMNAEGTRIVVEPHWLTLGAVGVTGTLTATVIDAAGDTVDAPDVAWASEDAAIATVNTAGVVTSIELGKTKVTATYDSATAWATVEVALSLTDREILEAVYEATGGHGWTDNTNWLSDASLSEWYGVSTDGNGRVTHLDLLENELTGAIPAEIGGLEQLDLLRTSYNSISGPIPAELGKLTRLARLELNNNEHEGGLPPEMGGMQTLDYLDVAHNNDIVGTVPHSFAGLELSTFYSTSTDLCVPPSLRAWFDGIPRTDNPTPCTARITFDPPSLYFGNLGDTATLSATAISAEGDTLQDAAVTWASADTEIASVDTKGLVTAIAYGTTQITATAGLLSGAAEVEVVFVLSDREVLEILYASTGGENWTDTTNWMSDEPLSEWYGVQTNETGKVVGLSLANNNLTGSIPDELGELGDLATLDLGRNTLSGPVPGHLGNLPQLRNLLLHGNALEGVLPRDLGYMTGLRYLHIGDNKLSGVVPGSFANLELDTLYAVSSGVCVPPSLGAWLDGIGQTDELDRCVASIAIEVAGLESPTFYAIGESATLSAKFVSAEGDTLSTVPATWSSRNAAVVSVDETGTVTAVGNGKTEVTATYETISASIDVVVDLPENDRDVLEILYDRARGNGWTDATNWLTEEPLSEWAGVETDISGRVVGLSLSGNNLRGPIHSSIGQLDQLVTLDLNRNWISGSIPVQLADLTRLRHLTLSVNGLVGNLPSAFGALDSLRTLKFGTTSVSGRIPASFADLDLDTLLANGTTVCVPPSLSGWLESIPETDNPPACTGRVLVEPQSLTFRTAGDTARLSATVIDAEGAIVDDAAVTWRSADAAVARVDGNGLVTARAIGVAAITATYNSVVADPADVVVRLPGSDRVALEALYRATGGDDWRDNTNWMSDDPLSAWKGVTTTDDGRVRRIELHDNNLTGRIPAAIGLLDSLVYLDFDNNGITGAIPAAIGRLHRVERLYLGQNELSGPLPPEMGNMAGLRYLEVNETRLVGQVPTTFANLGLKQFFAFGSDLCIPRSLDEWSRTIEQRDEGLLHCIPITGDRDVLVEFYNATGGPDWGGKRNWLTDKSLNLWQGITTDDEGYVTEIYLTWNNLTGSLPPRLGDLARLEVLILYVNELTGRIPPELGNLTRIREFALSSNQLEGTIPPELGNLSGVKEMYLSNNQLTGPIPTEFGNLAELEVLWLFNNQLSGPLPAEFGNLKKLRILWASDNNFEGLLPPELGDMTSLVDITLSRNRITGSIPPELGKLQNLTYLGVPDNQLTGPIPPEIGNMASLKEIILMRNQLSGSIPPELGNLANLEWMWLFDNKFTGPIPAELGNLSKLRDLAISTNMLTGSIPPELGQISALEALYLMRNNLTGPIPPELGNLAKLETLWLFTNNLSGSIPAELGNLSALEDLNVGDNQITGSIPPELGQLSSLETLGARSNNLTGPIPPELGQLTSLADLSFHENNLSGQLPPELGNLTSLESFTVDNNMDLEGLMPRSMMNLPLGYLDISSTYVCPHLDDEFQEWLDGIPRAYGLWCPPTLTERFALEEFYAAAGGDSWTNNSGWDSDTIGNNWHGVTVDATDTLVRKLALPSNGLNGSIAPAIANLQKLETLVLGDNSLTGGIPVAVAFMDGLDTLRISGNTGMEGPLPFRMTEMTGLKALQYTDTGLCASPSVTFQRWIDGLDLALGATCDNATAVRLSLPMVYLNQAVQRPAGDIPLLSGRKALLRVFLEGDQSNAYYEPEVVATFMRDGEEVYRAVMQSLDDRVVTAADEGNLRTSYNVVVPAEHIVAGTEMVVVADSAETIPRAEGSQTRFPEAGSAALDVIDVPPLELTAVPVLYADNPDSSVIPWTDNIAELGEESPHVGLFRYAFPLSEFITRHREPYVTSLDPTDEDTTWDLLLEMEPVYRAEKATGYWYAVADSEEGYVRGIARRNGLVSFGKPREPELAHEVGHNLNLAHAPCGGALGTDPDFPYSNGSIGVWGYDFRNGSVVSPYSRRDIMGYCYDQGWLSDYYFEKVIRVRANKDETWTNGDLAGAGPEGEMLVLWGGVRNGELRIEPVHPMYTAPKLPAEAGAYRIEGFGRAGSTEFSLAFTPGEDQYGNRYFFFAVPVEADWENSLERITLTGPEGEVTVDRNDPRSLTIVTDPATGRIRAILRDWDRPLPSALGNTGGLEVVTTRGIVEAVRLRR